MGRRTFKTYLAATALCAAVFGAYCAFLASGPDTPVSFTREVPTLLPLETLSRSIEAITNWPEWFFNAGKIERVDASGRSFPTSEQKVQKGALVRIEILPHRGEHRGGFDILVTVREYVPGKLLDLEVLSDQSGRIIKLFDHLEWKIELARESSGIVIRGTELARTRHWRSRLFAALSPRILLNQVFYPDLMALGQFTQPKTPNLYPAYGQ